MHPDHDLGLPYDLGRLQQQARERRAASRWLLGAGASDSLRSDIGSSITSSVSAGHVARLQVGIAA